MFIRITKSKNTQNVYLVEGYRDKNGKTKQRIIKKYGRLEQLMAKDENIIDKLKREAYELTADKNISINISNYRKIKEGKKTKNYGYFYLEAIYNSLGINSFLKKMKQNHNFKYDINEIMKMLVFSRIMNPSSKLETYKNQDVFFKSFHNNLIDIYRSLSVMNHIKDEIQIKMHKKITENYGRDTSLVLYDLTNYYFETEKEDELKKVGVSKERKTTPIVQMGLLIDKNKIPIGYQLFPGNTHDSKTVIPMIKKLKEKFGIKRTILTADKGINTSFNFANIVKHGDGYIVSQKIRGSKKEFINEVLNDEGYTYWGKSFKYKEVFRNRIINDVNLKEKIVIYWSENFDQREKHKREKLNKKIEKFLHSPASLNASNAYGIKKYIKTKHLDKTTGEIVKVNPKNIFNLEKYDRDVALDGYYAIVTSELKKPVREILASYHELWKIEESFRVIKSDLEGRPIFVRREDRIEGHFLTCFIALTILRLLENKLKSKYSVKQIKKSLKHSTCKEFTNGYYTIEPFDDIANDIQKLFKTYISNDVMSVEGIRKFSKLGNTTFF